MEFDEDEGTFGIGKAGVVVEREIFEGGVVGGVTGGFGVAIAHHRQVESMTAIVQLAGAGRIVLLQQVVIPHQQRILATLTGIVVDDVVVVVVVG